MTYLSVCSGIEAATVAWEPKPDEWVIVGPDRYGGVTLATYRSINQSITPCARYEQADGTLTDLRGGWGKVKDRTEVRR